MAQVLLFTNEEPDREAEREARRARRERFHPLLKVGERIELPQDGDGTVVRVTPCAAYVRLSKIERVDLPSGRSFTARSGKVVAVAPTAAVRRIS